MQESFSNLSAEYMSLSDRNTSISFFLVNEVKTIVADALVEFHVSLSTYPVGRFNLTILKIIGSRAGAILYIDIMKSERLDDCMLLAFLNRQISL